MFDFLKKKSKPEYTDDERAYLSRAPPRHANDGMPSDDELVRMRRKWMDEDAANARRKKSVLGDFTRAGKVAIGVSQPRSKPKTTTATKRKTIKKKPATKRKAKKREDFWL